MLVRYFSQRPRKHSRVERISLGKVKGDSVLRNCTRAITAQLPIPATPPTSISQCSLIQIVYQVEVEAKMSGMYANQVVSVPVIIGNIPLQQYTRGVVSQQPMASGSRELNNNVDQLNEAEVKKNEAYRTNTELPVLDAVATAPDMAPTPHATEMRMYFYNE